MRKTPTVDLINNLRGKITEMYSQDGLSKSEISRRLRLNRKILSRMITSWGIPFNINGYVYPIKSTVKFIDENKDFIIFMFDNDYSVSEIARRLNVDRKVINTTCIYYDPDIHAAYIAAKIRAKRRSEERINRLVKKSTFNYDFEEIEGEEWKKIDEYPGYEVSNMGRVKHYAQRYNLFYLLTPNYTCVNKNRVYFSLHNKDGRINKSIARLVATYFVDGKIHEDDEVNHIDGNPMNNVYTNLEWVTPDDNRRHYHKVIANHYNNDIIISITFMGKTFYSIDTFAEFVGESKEVIESYLLNNSIHEYYDNIDVKYNTSCDKIILSTEKPL